MNSTEEMERIQTLIQYQHGFLFSKAMFTACELGVFDLLLESGEPLSSATIAERLGTSTHGMELLLGACMALKLLRTERKDEQGIKPESMKILEYSLFRFLLLSQGLRAKLHVTKVLYENTELSSLFLCKSSPKSQYYHNTWFSENTYLYSCHLADAVREGKNQLEKLPDPKDVYDHIYRSEESTRKFILFMNAAWSLWGRDVLATFDLSRFPHICDLGGSGGTLAKECIDLYPDCTVAVFDLPDVVRIAKKHFVSEEEQRIKFLEGDFFEGLVPEADLYVLTRILHNWDDKKCVQLLTKVYKACKPGGGVLVIDMVVNEDGSGNLMSQIYSLLMLLHAEGKERTLSEIRRFLRAAGFKEAEGKKTNTPYAVILAIK